MVNISKFLLPFYSVSSSKIGKLLDIAQAIFSKFMREWAPCPQFQTSTPEFRKRPLKIKHVR